jgi:hypothetical protein
MSRFEDADGHRVWPLTSFWKPGSGEVWKRRPGHNDPRHCFATEARGAHRIGRENEIAFELKPGQPNR